MMVYANGVVIYRCHKRPLPIPDTMVDHHVAMLLVMTKRFYAASLPLLAEHKPTVDNSVVFYMPQVNLSVKLYVERMYGTVIYLCNHQDIGIGIIF